jgi:hypothetical protein
MTATTSNLQRLSVVTTQLYETPWRSMPANSRPTTSSPAQKRKHYDKPIVAASDNNSNNRKHLSPPSDPAKKNEVHSPVDKTSTDTFWQSRIRLTAIERWEEHVYLSKPGFPFKQCWAKEMHWRDKQRNGDRKNLEEGEIEG